MGKKSNKRYSPKFKFTVVLEVLKSEKSDAEVARAFDVHPATVSRCKQAFVEKGSEEVKEYEDRIGQLERMLGQKEVEIALLKNLFFRELNLDERIELVAVRRCEHGLNRCLEALGVSKGTWHCRMRGGSKQAERKARDEALRAPGDPGASVLRVPPESSGA